MYLSVNSWICILSYGSQCDAVIYFLVHIPSAPAIGSLLELLHPFKKLHLFLIPGNAPGFATVLLGSFLDNSLQATDHITHLTGNVVLCLNAAQHILLLLGGLGWVFESQRLNLWVCWEPLN